MENDKDSNNKEIRKRISVNNQFRRNSVPITLVLLLVDLGMSLTGKYFFETKSS